MKKKEILAEWLSYVDTTHFTKEHYDVIYHAMEEYKNHSLKSSKN